MNKRDLFRLARKYGPVGLLILRFSFDLYKLASEAINYLICSRITNIDLSSNRGGLFICRQMNLAQLAKKYDARCLGVGNQIQFSFICCDEEVISLRYDAI